MHIDWTRVAKPQHDGYDSTVAAFLEPEWRKRSPQGQITLCDGAVRVCRTQFDLDDRDEMDGIGRATQEWADRQTKWLKEWPDGYAALKAYLDEFWPFLSKTDGSGSVSRHWIPTRDHPLHAISVSINDLPGCAQGIYHEFAHCRLWSLGIGVERHDGRLLLNGPDELHDSPFRRDKKRPVSAVLHGVYSWLMFTENDYQLYKAGKYTPEQYGDYSFRNFQKIASGIQQVRKYARWTTSGDAFAEGLYQWTADLLRRCFSVKEQVEMTFLRTASR